jgi:hypothetical protein
MLYFYNMNFFGSLFSAALQMNMERWVAYGETNEELERFLLLALLNGEKELATRYLNVMKKCAGMDSYSEKYERYIEKTDLLYKENEVYEKAFEKHFRDDFSWYSVSKGKYNPLC